MSLSRKKSQQSIVWQKIVMNCMANIKGYSRYKYIICASYPYSSPHFQMVHHESWGNKFYLAILVWWYVVFHEWRGRSLTMTVIGWNNLTNIYNINEILWRKWYQNVTKLKNKDDFYMQQVFQKKKIIIYIFHCT